MTDKDKLFDGSSAAALSLKAQGTRTRLLQDLLHRYTTDDVLENQHLARMLALASDGDRALSRNGYTPGHFTASAFVLNPERTHLLLIFHSKLKLWLQPGGHVEDDDLSIEAAARREVAEETGKRALQGLLSGPLDLDVHLIPERHELPAHEHFDVRFLYVANDMHHAANSDALAAQWVPLTELSTVATDESIRRAARKIVRILSTRETRS